MTTQEQHRHLQTQADTHPEEHLLHQALTEVQQQDHQVLEVIIAEALLQADLTTTVQALHRADHMIQADLHLTVADVLLQEVHLIVVEVAVAEAHRVVAEDAAAAVDNQFGESYNKIVQNKTNESCFIFYK